MSLGESVGPEVNLKEWTVPKRCQASSKCECMNGMAEPSDADIHNMGTRFGTKSSKGSSDRIDGVKSRDVSSDHTG